MPSMIVNRRDVVRGGILALTGFLAEPRSTSAQTDPAEPWLYLADPEGRSLRPVDPETLSVDLHPGYAFVAPESDKRGFTGWIASADGGTLVRTMVDPSPDGPNPYGTAELTIFDAATGVARSSFAAPAWSQQPVQLSADGRVLAIEAGALLAVGTNGGLEISGYPSWYLFDTATGKQIAQIAGDGAALAGLQRLGLLDQSGDRLFRLVALGQQRTAGPWPTQLVIHDVPSGAEHARIDLPEVMSGFWASGAATPQTGGSAMTPQSYATPSLIVAPNGQSLFVLDADGSHITEIDLDAAAVLRRVATGLAPLRTTNVEQVRETGCTLRYPLCLDSAGPEIHALAITDARHLIVGGYAIDATGDDARSVADYGLHLIDLDAGNVVETADAGPNTTLAVLFEQDRFWPTLDGAGYFAIGSRGPIARIGTPTESDDRLVLVRIAADLSIAAEHDVTDDGSTFLVVLKRPLPQSSR